MIRNIHNLFRYLTVITVTVSLLLGCKERVYHHLSGNNDHEVLPVKNVNVQNYAGGAHISYERPDGGDLYYVKAVYYTNDGSKKRVSKSSFYGNSLDVKGFLNESPHEVKLYSYSRGGNRSKAKIVNIHPLIPPLTNVYESIDMRETFGGVRLTLQNPDTVKMTITLVTKDSTLGRFTPAKREYTSALSDTFAVRGFKSVNQKFGYFVRDEFGNRSDTTYKPLKPLYEEQLDNKKFSVAHFPTDFGDVSAEVYAGITTPDRMFDGNVATRNSHDFWQTKSSSFPFWITIDLGDTYKISRFEMQWRPHYAQYTGQGPKNFEIWGGVNPHRNLTLPFDDSWTKLGEFNSVPPSGNINNPTSDDINKIYYENFNIPNAADKPPIKYIRIVINSSWGGIAVGEIGQFIPYGQPVNTN